MGWCEQEVDVSEHPRDDELLKTFLSGDSELSRRYRESDAEEPPAHIDAAILASARWAVGADRKGADRKDADREGAEANAGAHAEGVVDETTHGSSGATAPGQAGSKQIDSHLIGARRRHDFVTRWRIPLATAAVVVVAATLTLMIERDPENDRISESFDSAPSREIALNEPGSAAREHAAETPEQANLAAPAPDAASAKPAAPAAAGALKQGVGNQSKKNDSAKAEVAKKNTVRQKPEKPAAPAPPVTTLSKQQDINASKPPGAASEEQRTAQAAVARRAAEPLPQPQQVAPQSSSEPDDGEVASGRDSDAAVAGYTGAEFPDAGNPGATSGERRAEPSTLADVSTAAETKQTASAPSASEREQAFASASDESVQSGSADSREPEQWIRDINELLAQGKRAQAIDSLKAFRGKYPDYQLTPELRALLPADAQ